MSDLKAMRSAKSLKGEASRFLASSLALLLSWTAVIPAATSSAFAQQSTEDVRFFHHDAHGAILAVTNRDGQVVWRDSPRPFGDVDGSASASGHSKFLDRPLEPTGLYELGERFYDPRYGRFLSQDPASLLEVDVTKPDGFNRFAYGLNNPYRYNDATGRVPVETILDAIDIGVSLHDLWNEPSWSNGLFLAWSIGAVRAGDRAADAARGGAQVVRVGQAGESAVPAAYNIGDNAKILVNGRNRIPDGLTNTVLSEVKNVKSLSFSRQLRDFADFAQQRGRRFDLYVRPNTTLSGALQEAVPQGTINLRFIP
ncbi:MAG: hypothetical protein IPK13_02495 [Deltaproteobacteria bacterium]|nr:hypothetical protein [Deltaproteobacteria bacterium]